MENGHVVLRSCRSDPTGCVVPSPQDRVRGGAGRGTPRPSCPDAPHQSRVVGTGSRPMPRTRTSMQPTFLGRYTPPSTRPSACYLSSRPATAGISAESQPPTTQTPANRASLFTTDMQEAPVLPSKALVGRSSGSAPPVRPSPTANASTVVPHACSHPNAVTATTRSTRLARSRC